MTIQSKNNTEIKKLIAILNQIASAKVLDDTKECNTNNLGEVFDQCEKYNWDTSSNEACFKKIYSTVITDLTHSGQSFARSDSYLEIMSSLAISSLGTTAAGLSHGAHALLKQMGSKIGGDYRRSTGSHNTMGDTVVGGGSDRSTSVQVNTDAVDAIARAAMSAGAVPTVVYHSADQACSVFLSDEDVLRAARARWLAAKGREDEEWAAASKLAQEHGYAVNDIELDDQVKPLSEWEQQLEVHKEGVASKRLVEINDKAIKEKLGEEHELWEWFFELAIEEGPARALHTVYPYTEGFKLMGSSINMVDRFAIAGLKFAVGVSNGEHPGLLCKQLLEGADLKEHWLHYGLTFESGDWSIVVEHGAIKIQRLGSRIISVQSPCLRTLQNWFDTICRAYQAASLTTTFSPETARHYHMKQSDLLSKESLPLGGDYNTGARPMNQTPWDNAPTDSIQSICPQTTLGTIASAMNEEFSRSLLAIGAVSMYPEVAKASGISASPQACKEAIKLMKQEASKLGLTEAHSWYTIMDTIAPDPEEKPFERMAGPGGVQYIGARSESIMDSPNGLLAVGESDKSAFTDCMPAGATACVSRSLLHGERSHEDVYTPEEHMSYLAQAAVSNQKLFQDEEFAGRDTTNYKGEVCEGTATVHGKGCLCCSKGMFYGMYSDEVRKRFGMGSKLYCINRHGVSQGFSAHAGSLYQLFCNTGLGYSSIICFNNDDGLKARRLPNDVWQHYLDNRSSAYMTNTSDVTESSACKLISLCIRTYNYVDVVFGGSIMSSCGGSLTNSKKSSGGIAGHDPSISVVYRNIGLNEVIYTHAVGAAAAINTIPYTGIEGLNSHFLEAVVAGVAASGLPMSLAGTIGKIWHLLLSVKVTGKNEEWLPWAPTAIFEHLTQERLAQMLDRVKKFKFDSGKKYSADEVDTIKAYIEAANNGVLYTFPKTPALSKRLDTSGINGPRPDYAGTLLSYDSSFNTWANYRYRKAPLTMLIWQRSGCHKRPQPVISDLAVSFSQFTILDTAAPSRKVTELRIRGAPYSVGSTQKVSELPWHTGRAIGNEITSPLVLTDCEEAMFGVKTTHVIREAAKADLVTDGGVHKMHLTEKNQHTGELVHSDVSVALCFDDRRGMEDQQQYVAMITVKQLGATITAAALMERRPGSDKHSIVLATEASTNPFTEFMKRALEHLGFALSSVRSITSQRIATYTTARRFHLVHKENVFSSLKPGCTHIAEVSKPCSTYISDTATLSAMVGRERGSSVVTRWCSSDGKAEPSNLSQAGCSTVRTADLDTVHFARIGKARMLLRFTTEELYLAKDCVDFSGALLIYLTKAESAIGGGVREVISKDEESNGITFKVDLNGTTEPGTAGNTIAVTWRKHAGMNPAAKTASAVATVAGLADAVAFMHFVA